MSDSTDRLNRALSGRYRIERELGEGGMATVYLAEDLRHARKVAIKVLKPELAAVVGSERFLTEIRTTAKLQHPHILPLFESGEADGFLWYVMPYVEGESLRERLDREKQLPVAEAVTIATKVAGALQAAHDQGVVHRDVKPANVLLDARGEPLVADFGIALAVSQAGGGRLTETGLSLGTPYYMSPEQATADRDPEARSDVYALGCVLYEMIVGDPPHTASTAQAVVAKILTEAPSAPSGRRPTVPVHVDAAVLRALEKVPADRFRSARAFAEALGDPGFRHERGGGTTAPAGPRGDQPGGPRRWTGTFDVSRAGAMAVLSGLPSWSETGGAVLVSPEGETPLPLRNVLGHVRISLSSDGGFVAYLLRGGTTLIQDLRTGSVEEISGTALAGSAWFPDGSRIAIGHLTENVLLIARPADDGPPRRVEMDDGVLDPTDGLPDGRIVAERRRSGEEGDVDLVLADPSDGSVEPLLDGEWWERQGRVSPDGRWLAYESWVTGEREIYARSFPDLGPEARISRAEGLAQILPEFRVGPFWSADGDALYHLEDGFVWRTEVDTTDGTLRVAGRDTVGAVHRSTSWWASTPTAASSSTG